MFEHVFTLLLKYRPVVFEQGRFAFSPPWPAAVTVLLAVLAGAAVIWSYRRLRGASAPSGARASRAWLLGLRVAVLALVLACLLRPVLILRAVEPQRNFLAILVDDSRSMAIADGGAPRAAFPVDALGPAGALRRALAGRFSLRFFRFSTAAERIGDPRALAFAGSRSNVVQAVDQVTHELAGLPVSGIVLASDGADTSQAPVGEALAPIKASGIPVFAVGVGQEAFVRDVQVGRVEPPSTVLKGSTLVVDVPVSQTGYAGRTVPFVVEDEGRIVGSEDLTLPPDGRPATVGVRFTLADPGPRLLRFRIAPLEGEQVAENNVREALVTVVDRREKLLYIEGEPRFEMKFLRQAVADDKNLQVVTLQRTAEGKFLRLDVDHRDDLLGGFPKTREELFEYRGLILGSLEASAFTPDQQRMINDFVSVRGGGLLALGGRHAFAEGGYAGTPVADALPVLLDPKAPDSFVAQVKVHPTRAGETHVATQIADTEQASDDRWRKLPALTSVNPIHRVKPGSEVLLAAGAQNDQVVLAYQRYGAGKAIALPVQDSWLWRMDAATPVEDPTYQTLWRRLLRWTVDGVPDRLAVASDHERVEPGERVTLTATLRDKRFLPMNDATVVARVIRPSAPDLELPMSFVLDRDGEYRADFVPDRNGLYEVRVSATPSGSRAGVPVATPEDIADPRGTDPTVRAAGYVRVGPDEREYFDAAMRAPLLKRIANETGGRFYTPATAGRLAEDITYLGRGVTVAQQKELWDMPVVFLALLGMVAAEWMLRRRWGLA